MGDGTWILDLNLWLLAGLAVVNIPFYVLVGWVVFDSWDSSFSSAKKSAPRSRYEGMLYSRDFDGEAAGLGLEIIGFLTVCFAAVAGEYYLITQYFG